MAANKKEIRDFNLQSDVSDTDLFVLQTAAGTTLNATKSGILNDVNSILVGLQAQIDQISVDSDTLKGKLELNVDEHLYTIMNSNITENSIPVCTIKTPYEGSTIPIVAITEVISGGFSVELSCSPAISGYELNYQI
jgi:hypothetical protein